MADQPFDDLTDIYEAMIDWPKRLANEESFYRRLFERFAAQRVVDVACGTGRHAAMFHSWGLNVEAADISPNMIARARTSFGEPHGLRWVVRGFDEPILPEQPFDVALCTGNSLALAGDMASAERAMQQMLAAVRSGGSVVVHVLNLWRLPDGPCVWQKFKRAELPRGEVLIAKGVHRSGSGGFVNVIVTPLAAPDETHHASAPFLGFETTVLEEMALQTGAEAVQFLGGYQSESYDRDESIDLIMIVEK